MFTRLLGERQTDPAGRRWLHVPYDQLSDKIGPLARENPSELGIIVIENPWKAARRPYHKQKLALVIVNLRHFALEQAAKGVAVEHVVVRAPYRRALEDVSKRLGRIRLMRPAERELRVDLEPLVASGALEVVPHEGWLTTKQQFDASHPNGAPYLLERFYRFIRRQTGVLMQSGKPEGGHFNFDKENRSPYDGKTAVTPPPSFPNNPVKEEVIALIEEHYSHHPGKLNPDMLPSTAEDAESHWAWAKIHALPWFGKYEDAMSAQSSTLFHTRTSALVNLHRLLPSRVMKEASGLDIPLASKEGFIRQVLGWREFIHHVHEATDGFRKLPDSEPLIADEPGDGGFAHWRKKKWVNGSSGDDPDGGSTVSALKADVPLPPLYWGRKSGLTCLDTVVESVWGEGWSHHIARLMILSNFATLLGVSPRELTDWFWVAYIDAYDWVVEPNVLGLGTFATGQLFTTKPYVSGANYIRRMSDYCDHCRFIPGKTCPYTPMYWAFLKRHRKLLEQNQRLRVLYRNIEARGDTDEQVLRNVRDLLSQEKELTPENIGTAPSSQQQLLKEVPAEPTQGTRWKRTTVESKSPRKSN